ncbi:rod shape-determining protein MreD [Methylomonas sp. LL1]|uniref:rod shape-determining protein MreD n=1 Tax=Methylomonas sp. LL1 TaxID=2785785 RepID=UPI0018C41CE4|nr:rod shape-determining protein MreD [Methylomonas sp. LL1]QPK61893.1 rod shape-determining protein MreD [Methylomonas sp. LL1]
MPAHNPFAAIYFILTLAAAMMLRVMSLFPGMDEFNPDWIVLVLIYWSIALPERVGVFTAFWVGLLTDVLTGHLLGQHALIYALISFLSIKEHRRLRQFPLPQQCLFVLFCLVCGQSLIFGMESMQAPNRLPLSFWYPVITGTLAWPLVFLVLRAVRVLARISG